MYSNPKYKKCSMNNTNIPNQESQNSKKTLGKPSLPFRHSVHSLPCRSRNTESLRANWNKGLFHIRHHHRPEASTASGLVEGDLTFSHRNNVEISAISIFINVHVECQLLITILFSAVSFRVCFTILQCGRTEAALSIHSKSNPSNGIVEGHQVHVSLQRMWSLSHDTERQRLPNFPIQNT